MKSIITKNGMEKFFKIDSAGILNYHEGKQADQRMKNHAAKREHEVTSISRQVNPAVDFIYFDLLVAMDNSNYNDLLSLAPDEQSKSKVVKLTSFIENSPWDEVPDPYYGGPEGFELVLDILEIGCNGLFRHLTQDKKSQ